MDWLTGVTTLRNARQEGTLVTVAAVRGHAPRDAGAKMVVGRDRTWGTIGGGNLEAVAVERSREHPDSPELITLKLSARASGTHGVQCCGGEVTLLLEPLTAPPVVAVFGFGHVGLELARILIRHELELHLIDSRTGQFTHDRLAFLWEGTARPVLHDVPIVPERVLAELPPGAHVLVMTHDHAEDLAICDQALRTPSIGSIGLIGSATKRARFHHELQSLGHPEGLGRIRCPIGLPGITEKSPAAIAVSVAAELLPLVPSRSFNSSSAAVS